MFFNFKKEKENSQSIISLLSYSGIFIGILFIVISSLLSPANSFAKELLLGLGIAIAPSGIIALIGNYMVFGRTIEKLEINNSNLNDQIRSLRVSTEFLRQSSELGLEMIYPDRPTALEEFAPLMREQANQSGKEKKGRLIIVGSSIKGLREAIRNFEEIIHNASINEDCTFQILLTHPNYSSFRENQEERPKGAIEEEVFQSMLLLENAWGKTNNEDEPDINAEDGSEKCLHNCVKLYKGTPTCFMIIAGNHMLVNPYPYEKEAFKSFCLLVKEPQVPSDSEEIPKSIYQQYYQSHFNSPWSRNALHYKHYYLHGPINSKAWDTEKRFGDIFVVQDSGRFNLTIVLSGERGAELRGIPPTIAYHKDESGASSIINIGDEFYVNLLKVTSDTSKGKPEWVPANDENNEQSSKLILDKDRRSGKYSCEITGNFENEYDMVGIFGVKEEQNSPFSHADYARADLRNTPLPLFWHTITKSNMFDCGPVKEIPKTKYSKEKTSMPNSALKDGSNSDISIK